MASLNNSVVLKHLPHISNLKFLHLPHINTSKQFTNFTTPSSGFNPDILAWLVEDIKLENISEYEKNVVIVFDEMRIKSDLVFQKSTGQIVGFTEMGDINEEFRDFEESFEKNELM